MVGLLVIVGDHVPDVPPCPETFNCLAIAGFVFLCMYVWLHVRSPSNLQNYALFDGGNFNQSVPVGIDLVKMAPIKTSGN